MSDYTYRMTISGSGKGLASPIISKVSHFPAARLAIIIGGVAPGLTRIDGAVQTTAAGTPGFPALHRKVFVECQKEFV